MDATTFIIIAGMAFFFFLIPAKQFKQAFIAMAFVLFVSLAVITLSTEEFTMTEVITHDHFYTPQQFTKNDVDVLEINQALANGWGLGADLRPDEDDDGQGLSIAYQEGNRNRPDRINIAHKATENNASQDEWTWKILTTDTALRKIIVEIEVVDIDDHIDNRYNDNQHTGIGLHDIRGDGSITSALFDTYQRIGNGNQIVTMTIPPEYPRNQIALRITPYYDLTSDFKANEYLYHITGITIEKAPIPESKLEHIRETKTYPVITFGKLNIAISFIFIFLAMINLMIFISDTVQWKRKKSNKPL